MLTMTREEKRMDIKTLRLVRIVEHCLGCRLATSLLVGAVDGNRLGSVESWPVETGRQGLVND